MLNKKIAFLIVLSFLLLLQIQSSAVKNSFFQSPEPRYGGTLIDSSSTDAQILNPVLSKDQTSKKIEEIIFQSLITYDKEMDIIPELATSWEISATKLDYTFYLRNDVFWHDGEQFTADDVIFTWDRILDPETETTSASLFDLIDLVNIPYEKIDDFTVIFHLQANFSPMLNDMMFPIIPEHVYLNHDGLDGIKHTADDCRDNEGVYTFNDDPSNLNPIGTGPVLFIEWEIDDHITLIRNSVENGGPGNWREHDTYLDRYLLRVVSDVNVQLLALQAGDIHMMDLSSTSQEDIEALYNDYESIIYASPSYKTDHIAFQTDPSKGNLYGSTSRDFTSNPNHFAGYEWQAAENPDIYGHLVRQALNYALDKEGLIDHAYPQGSRNLGPLPYSYDEWYNDQVEPYDYDLTKANQLLELAGFGATADSPLRSELNFKISYNQGNLRREKICKFAYDQWANLGIDVEIENLEWISMLYTHYDDRNFDAMASSSDLDSVDPDLTIAWSSRNIMPGGQPIGLNTDGTWIWSGSPRVGGLNYMSYWNPAVDILMDKARTEEAFSVRKTYYDQIQERIVDDSPLSWLFTHVNMMVVDKNFHGFVMDSLAGFWPEPVGFRNIYQSFGDYTTAYPPQLTDTDSNTESTNTYTSNTENNNIFNINLPPLPDIVMSLVIITELVALVGVVSYINKKRIE